MVSPYDLPGRLPLLPRRPRNLVRMTARWELWPANPESLIARQRELGAARPDPWRPTDPQHLDSAGCWVCFPRRVTGPGTGSDPAWCVAVLTRGGGVADRRLVRGTAAAPYVPG